MLKTKADNAKNPIFTAVVEKSELRFFSMKNIFFTYYISKTPNKYPQNIRKTNLLSQKPYKMTQKYKIK